MKTSLVASLSTRRNAKSSDSQNPGRCNTPHSAAFFVAHDLLLKKVGRTRQRAACEAS
jgi:hypothetical protein